MNTISKSIFFAFLLSFLPLVIYGAYDSTPFVVVIDAGHGGKDPGAIGGFAKEKDINLSVALKLGTLLENSNLNLKVYYTRKTDVFVDLSKRADISNKVHANLFISIHSNASKSSSARGTETYVMGMEKNNANLQVAMRENSVITYENDYLATYQGYNPNSPESFILFSLQQNIFQSESLLLASILQKQYMKNSSSHLVDKGVKQANFLVLWKTSAPSILTEIGFITNIYDRSYISSLKGQNSIAKSIYESVISYINTLRPGFDSSAKSANDFSVTTDVTDRDIYVKHQVDVNSKLRYKVQILSVQIPVEVSKTNFNFWKDRVICEYNGLIFKYFVLGANVYKETLTLRDSLRPMFPDCFIVATYDGKPIDLEKARSIEN